MNQYFSLVEYWLNSAIVRYEKQSGSSPDTSFLSILRSQKQLSDNDVVTLALSPFDDALSTVSYNSTLPVF